MPAASPAPAALNVLLTGPTGAVGSQVLQQLVATPHRITVFEKHSDKAEQALAPYAGRITTVWGDITQPASLAPACHGQDVVLHVAALIPPVADEKPELAQKINVDGTAHLLAALQQHAPDAFVVYTSSISVYGDRIDTPWIRVGDPLQASEGDAYATTKIQAEALLQASALGWCIVRLTAIMGVGNHQMSGLMFHMPLDTALEISTPADTARALVHAVTQRAALQGRIFNLGGGQPCRTLYRNYLAQSFAAFGLGKLNFPPHAFAEKNFHCGYYADSDALEAILHFRRDTLASHYAEVRASVPPLQRWATWLVRGIAKRMLLAKSEPYHAWQTGNQRLMARFFKTHPAG